MTITTITPVTSKLIVLPLFIDEYGETIGIRLTIVNVLSNMILRQQYYNFPKMFLRVTYQDGSLVSEKEIDHEPYSARGYDFQFYKEIHKVFIVVKEDEPDNDDVVGISGEVNERILLKQEMDFRGTDHVFINEDAHWHLPVGSWRELAVKSNNPNIEFIPKVVIHLNHHVYYDRIFRQMEKYLRNRKDTMKEDDIVKGCRVKLLKEWFDSLKDIYRRHVYESYPLIVYGLPHLTSGSNQGDQFIVDIVKQLDEEMFMKENEVIRTFGPMTIINLKWNTHDELKETMRRLFGQIESGVDTLMLCLDNGVFDIANVFNAYDFYDDIFTYLMEHDNIRKLILMCGGRGNGIKYTLVKGDKVIDVVKSVCMTARITNDKHEIKVDDNWLVTDKFEMSVTTERGNGYELIKDGQIVASTKKLIRNDLMGKINNAIKMRNRRERV